jgi:hypothetical protein
MKRLLQPFIVTVTAILALGYVYLAVRLSSNLWQRVGLALPFILVWLVPVVYWGGNRDRERALDHVLHQASYLCMAWLSFLLVLTLGRDVALLLTMWSPSLAPVHDLFEQAACSWCSPDRSPLWLSVRWPRCAVHDSSRST